MRAPIPGTHEAGFVEQPILQRKVSPHVAKYWQSIGIPKLAMKLFTMGDCTIIVAREPAGANDELLWHLSISHEDRHPTWDEIKTARYRLLDNTVCFGLLLPPPESYVNVPTQDHVFHLWEITDPRSPWSGE